MLQTYKTINQDQETMSQLQETVNALLETPIKPDRLKRDVFFTLLHSVMKQSNLDLKNENGAPITITEYILSKRTSDEAIYEALFTFDNFISMPVKIICCPLADIILINATIPQIYMETYSICFKINKYIITSDTDTAITFANLDELFSLFKEKIALPLKNAILNNHQVTNASLLGLPNDIMRIILLKLTVRDILNVAESCKRIYAVVKEHNLWFQLYRRDFPGKNATEQNDWYETYKGMYALTKSDKLKHAEDIVADSFEDFRVLPGHLRAVDSRWEVIL